MTDAAVCPDMSKVVVASEQGRLFVFPAIVEATFDEDQVYISPTFFVNTLQKAGPFYNLKKSLGCFKSI